MSTSALTCFNVYGLEHSHYTPTGGNTAKRGFHAPVHEYASYERVFRYLLNAYSILFGDIKPEKFNQAGVAPAKDAL
jgi:hypothetical protein